MTRKPIKTNEASNSNEEKIKGFKMISLKIFVAAVRRAIYRNGQSVKCNNYQ